MQTGELKRQLGFWDSVAINIGIVIGVGIFRVPADIAKYLESSSFMLLAWLLGGGISLLGVLCYAELSSCFPKTGGTYIFLREAYGRGTAFIFGWMEFLVLRAGSLAGVAYVLAAYCKNFIYFGPGTEKMIAISAIVLFTAVNICGLRYGTGVQNVLSSLKVLTLLLITALIFNAGSERILLPATHAEYRSEWLALAPALIPVLWSYGGWNESTFMSGEFKDTKKALPYSLITSILIITVLYVLVNTAYLRAMTPDEIAVSKSIASDIFKGFFGRAGFLMITVAVLISAAGALNSTILTGARIPFALAQDTPRLTWLGGVHKKYDTPARAFVVNGLWAIALIVWGSFEELLFFTGFAKWLFFTMAGVSVFLLRKKLSHPESYRMIGYPVVPILFTIVSFILFITTIVFASKSAILGFGLLLLGIPVYIWMHPAPKKTKV